MIYLLSDIHGRLDFDAFNKYINEPHGDDLLIILGDTELNFPKADNWREFTDFFLNVRCNIAIVDGNHENFEYLNALPTEDWCGGKVHRLSPYIVHLMRGECYELEGKSFFVFGGCKSSQGWFDRGLVFEGQCATETEYNRAYSTLARLGHKVDYILTHKYNKNPEDKVLVEELRRLTCYIDENVDFKLWYYGHTHVPRILDSKHICVYNRLVPLTYFD